MPAGHAEQFIALALVFVVHVVGAVMLVWALLDAEQRAGWRRRRGGGGGGEDDPRAPQGPPDGGGGARAPLPLPLADGEPSRVRLREPVAVADHYPRPPRRPAHPERRPAPVRERRPGS